MFILIDLYTYKHFIYKPIYEQYKQACLSIIIHGGIGTRIVLDFSLSNFLSLYANAFKFVKFVSNILHKPVDSL